MSQHLENHQYKHNMVRLTFSVSSYMDTGIKKKIPFSINVVKIGIIRKLIQIIENNIVQILPGYQTIWPNF
jgi:hypothetical protein